jgi:Asp-tRNA(Asn)/Glu-tRNA(Gln) amidotransferase A subunit family amidase
MTSKIPPPDKELYRLTASEVASHLRQGNFSVEAYVRSLLSRIEAREPDVKAWAYLDPALIISQAWQLDQIALHDRGPLHGIPVGIKDVIYTLGDLGPR